jgi:hypothetical protein
VRRRTGRRSRTRREPCGSPSEAGADAGVSDGGSTGAHDGSSDAAAAPGGLAYMVGIKTNSVSHGPATVQGWLGRPLDVAGTTITTTSYIGSNATYENATGSAAPLLEVSFPLLSIFGESNDLNDLAKAAARSCRRASAGSSTATGTPGRTASGPTPRTPTTCPRFSMPPRPFASTTPTPSSSGAWPGASRTPLPTGPAPTMRRPTRGVDIHHGRSCGNGQGVTGLQLRGEGFEASREKRSS